MKSYIEYGRMLIEQVFTILGKEHAENKEEAFKIVLVFRVFKEIEESVHEERSQ